jgi:hypothetical protein
LGIALAVWWVEACCLQRVYTLEMMKALAWDFVWAFATEW